jgi:dUTP pyrophosphatase
MILPMMGILPHPCRGSEDSAGIDLAIQRPLHIYPGESEVVDLHIMCEIPSGHFGMLTHRSSLAFKKRCIMSTGIIDSDYRGSISGLIFNLGKDIAHFEKGDRVAQLIIMPYKHVIPIASDQLGDTSRGEGGFGSSGA